MNALENNYLLMESMVDSKTCYGNYHACDEFFSEVEDLIIEKLVAQERRHKEWTFFSYSLSMCHWIPSNECVKLQFLPTNPRDKVAKYFAGCLNVIKKVQRKDIQHGNQDME